MLTKHQKKKHREYMRIWKARHPYKIRKASKKWRENMLPWQKTFKSISSRCLSKSHHYYKRGIKNKITTKELEFLWFGDKGYLLKEPTIDRIDSDGDYLLENCRYLEKKFNVQRMNRQVDPKCEYCKRIYAHYAHAKKRFCSRSCAAKWKFENKKFKFWLKRWEVGNEIYRDFIGLFNSWHSYIVLPT